MKKKHRIIISAITTYLIMWLMCWWFSHLSDEKWIQAGQIVTLVSIGIAVYVGWFFVMEDKRE